MKEDLGGTLSATLKRFILKFCQDRMRKREGGQTDVMREGVKEVDEYTNHD